MRKAHFTSRGFTLVELLVVIGIIALLISILLPSLAKARESANTMACLSNLKQIGLGITMYAADNRGLLPPSNWSAWTAPPENDQVYWYTLINPYVGGKGNTLASTGMSVGGANKTVSNVFKCSTATVDSGYSHYTANPIAIVRKAEVAKFPQLKLGSFKGAFKVALIMEGSQVAGHWSWSAETCPYQMAGGIAFWAPFSAGGISNTRRFSVVPGGQNIDTATFAYPPGADIRFRHNKNTVMNAVFADGHAGSFGFPTAKKLEPMIYDNIFPEGWRSK